MPQPGLLHVQGCCASSSGRASSGGARCARAEVVAEQPAEAAVDRREEPPATKIHASASGSRSAWTTPSRLAVADQLGEEVVDLPDLPPQRLRDHRVLGRLVERLDPQVDHPDRGAWPCTRPRSRRGSRRILGDRLVGDSRSSPMPRRGTRDRGRASSRSGGRGSARRCPPRARSRRSSRRGSSSGRRRGRRCRAPPAAAPPRSAASLRPASCRAPPPARARRVRVLDLADRERRRRPRRRGTAPPTRSASWNPCR